MNEFKKKHLKKNFCILLFLRGQIQSHINRIIWKCFRFFFDKNKKTKVRHFEFLSCVFHNIHFYIYFFFFPLLILSLLVSLLFYFFNIHFLLLLQIKIILISLVTWFLLASKNFCFIRLMSFQIFFFILSSMHSKDFFFSIIIPKFWFHFMYLDFILFF